MCFNDNNYSDYYSLIIVGCATEAPPIFGRLRHVEISIRQLHQSIEYR